MRIAAAVAAILPCCFLWKRYQGSLSPAWAMDDGAGQTSPARPRAHTACGDVEGVWEKDLAAFRGIPYGRAPIGSRRWKPADPAPCWPAGSVFNASRNGNICYQGSGGGPGESEDCLNLNVFAPNGAAAAAPLPVFVWIYGGSNVQGSVHADFYGPIENIVRRQRCILVAMNYRLGTLGFLALKELSAVDPRGNSGNAGIADQQLAMRWVQENIHAFGGDPRRVTLIGQSSGGTNILGHLASGSSRKLFHGAIALSPSANITMDRATKESQDRELWLPHLPCANVSESLLLDCLYAADAGALDAALPRSYSLFEALYDYPTNHVGLKSRMSALVFVDGSTITMPVMDALATGLNDVPLLLQSAQAELACAPDKELQNMSRQNFSKFLHQQFDPGYGLETTQEIWALYQHYAPPEYAAYAVDSDTSVACALRQLALGAKKGFGQPVYWTTVTGQPSGPIDGMHLPFHGWDFMAASGAFRSNYTPSARDVAFGERLLSDWFQLLSHGTLPEASGYRQVQQSSGKGVVGSIVGSIRTGWHDDHKGDVCAFWESIGVDQRWWWIN